MKGFTATTKEGGGGEEQGATDWTLILRKDRMEGLKEASLWTARLARGSSWAAVGLGTAGLISEDRDSFTFTEREKERCVNH